MDFILCGIRRLYAVCCDCHMYSVYTHVQKFDGKKIAFKSMQLFDCKNANTKSSYIQVSAYI